MALTLLSCGGGGGSDSGSPQFTAAMLDNQVFYRESLLVQDRAIVHFNQGGVLVERGRDNTSLWDNSGTWSVDANGVLNTVVGTDNLFITLVADTSAYMDITVDDGVGPPEPDRLYKTVAFDNADVVGTYTWEYKDLAGSTAFTWTVTFAPGGSGAVSGGGAFTWGINIDGSMWMEFRAGDKDTFYKLPVSTTSVLYMAGESVMDGPIDDVLFITLR